MSERKLPITNVGSVQLPSYDPGTALRLCERVAKGETLSQICKQKGFPDINTVYKWVVLYTEFAKAYHRAREMSASSMEEELLDMARELRGTNDFDRLKIDQYKVAMAQLRWSASRRDPKNFGERKPDSAGLSITINTSLDMNSGGIAGPGFDNVFKVSIEVPPAGAAPDPQTDITDAEFEERPVVDYNEDDAMEAFDLPEKAIQHLTTRNRPLGRPRGKGKYKSPQAIKAQITRQENKKKKDGLSEPSDGSGTG